MPDKEGHAVLRHLAESNQDSTLGLETPQKGGWGQNLHDNQTHTFKTGGYPSMDIAKIQALLQDFHLDGWLFSDFSSKTLPARACSDFSLFRSPLFPAPASGKRSAL